MQLSSSYSLQHFLFCCFALVRNSNKTFNKSNIQPNIPITEKVFNIKYSVCLGILIFYQIKEAHFNSQGSFLFFLNHGRALLDWWIHWHIPTARGTEAPTLRAHPDQDLWTSSSVCSFVNYNKLIILSFKITKGWIVSNYFPILKWWGVFPLIWWVIFIAVQILNQVYIPGMNNLIVMYYLFYILLDLITNISFWIFAIYFHQWDWPISLRVMYRILPVTLSQMVSLWFGFFFNSQRNI